MKAVKVSLREKAIAKGKKSLYLDFYPSIFNPITKKETRREFLGLYLIERPKTELEKQTNKETKILADNIRAKRQLEIQSENFGFFQQKVKDNDFLEYYRNCAKNRQGSNQSNWESTYKHLFNYVGGQLKMSEVTQEFLEDFKNYLLEQDLAINSQVSYFNKLRAAINQAFEEHLLLENPCLRVKGIKLEETNREFLTQEELMALVKTECDPPVSKQVALFSALTGLRWSDISNLTWEQVQHSENDGYFIRFIQQKTKGNETLPISKDAFRLMGERKDHKDKVFPDMKYSAWHNLRLKQWIMRTGITKEITFHCFRHTFATLQLTLDTDIYTISKMLGHKNLKTTQIYAKVIDKKKVEAVNKIDLGFDK